MLGISLDVITALISLGRNGVPGIPECLSDDEAAWRTLLCGNEPWRKAAKTLSENELRYLIQGLVLYSRERGSGVGGSVSPVIVLYYNYIARIPDQESELTAWVVDNRVNSYEPFGSSCDEGARSFAEFLKDRCVPWDIPWGGEIPRDVYARFGAEYVDESEYERRKQVEREARDEEVARRRRVKLATKLTNSVRNSDLKAVMLLLSKGADSTKAIDGVGSLVALAEENGREGVAAYLRSQGIS